MPSRPLHLEFGDTIGILAPASAPPDPSRIDAAVAVLDDLGFKTKLAPNARKRLGFLAGTDRQRASDLMRMFADPRVRAIVCVRGGYGTSRLLPLLDFRLIASHKKIFVGYSDITSLHSVFLSKCNLISFHGPMLNSNFANPKMPEATRESFLRTLTQPAAPGSICQGFSRKSIRVLRAGQASGRLVGGNLSILCASVGTPFQPSFKNRIVFFEDVDEVPYRFDRMLTQLLNAGLLQQAVGIAIGINKDCGDPKARKAKEYRQTVEDVFRERLLPLKVPIVAGLPFGHLPTIATLPVGAQCLLDGRNGDLVITEPAVC